MPSRRSFLTSAAATALGLTAAPLRAHVGPPHHTRASLGPRNVDIREDAEVGSIHVVPQWFVLYFVTSPGRAIEYHTAVGEAGRNFVGRAHVGRKEEWPSWTPTKNMIRREPDIYGKYADGMEGGPDNPLGARALYLYRGGSDTMYRIHGTPQPWTIGTAVSSGCIRLLNEHIIDLYGRVDVGAPVQVYGRV